MSEDYTIGPKEYRGIPVPFVLRFAWDTSSGIWWRYGVDSKCDHTPFDVAPGQIYRDNDYRSAGRTLRVDSIIGDGTIAVCTVLTNYAHVQQQLDGENHCGHRDMRGSITRIKTRRLYPNARGYVLLPEAA